MGSLGRWCFVNRRAVVAMWGAALVALGLLAGAYGGAFENDFRIAGSESQEAFTLLQERFPEFGNDPLVVPVRADSGVNDPAARQAVEAFFAEAAAVDGVESVTSPYSGPPVASGDGTITIGRITMDGFGPEVDPAAVREIIAIAEEWSEQPGLDIALGGPTAMFAELEPPGEREGVGVLIALVILVVTFGSVIAAGLPIVVALAGLGAGMTLVLLATRVVEVFTFAPAMAVMIGLGVGIDYALFIVTRYREGLSAGLEAKAAAATAVDTAGRAVLFAGATVIISLMGMVLIGVSVMVGMAVSASLAVACTVVAALTLLPAILGFIGTNIDRFAVGRIRADHDPAASVWHRWSRQVQRRPWAGLVGGLVLLLGLAVPVTQMELGGPHFGAGPESQSSRRAYDLVTEGFGEGFNGPLVLAAETDPARPEDLQRLGALVEQLAATEGVAAALPPIPNAAGDTAVITVIPDSAPHTTETQDLVKRLRGEVIPETMGDTGVAVSVSGVTALFADMADLLNRRLPVFIAVVLLLSFVLLLVVFRSVLVPLKAVLMNLLSIGAAYGVVVMIFQWGWGSSILGIDRPGPIMAFIPMMLFAILFGLSMDYEVFLLSRVREEYTRTGDNGRAVADGLSATARVITAAAAIMVIIFLSFVLGDDPIVKTFGLGLAVAVFLDATIVRMILVPATMELLGDANWWLPRWLDERLPTITLEAAEPSDVAPPAGVAYIGESVAAWLGEVPPDERGQLVARLEAAMGSAENTPGDLVLRAARRRRRVRLHEDERGHLHVTSATGARGIDDDRDWFEVRDALLQDAAVTASYQRARAVLDLTTAIRARREAQRLDVGELAERARTTPATVEAIERGGEGVDLPALGAVLHALGARVIVVDEPASAGPEPVAPTANRADVHTRPMAPAWLRRS